MWCGKGGRGRGCLVYEGEVVESGCLLKVCTGVVAPVQVLDGGGGRGRY